MRAVFVAFVVSLLAPVLARAEVNPEEVARRLMERGLVRLASAESLQRPVAISVVSDNPAVELYLIGASTTGDHGETLVPMNEQKLCRAPCQGVVEGHHSAQYFLGGNGVTQSAPFVLPEGEAVRIKVLQAGSSTRRTVASALAVTGVVSFVVGTVFVMSNGFSSKNADGASAGVPGRTIGGLIGMGGGLALLGGGIAFSATSETKFEVEAVDASTGL